MTLVVRAVVVRQDVKKTPYNTSRRGLFRRKGVSVTQNPKTPHAWTFPWRTRRWGFFFFFQRGPEVSLSSFLRRAFQSRPSRLAANHEERGQRMTTSTAVESEIIMMWLVDMGSSGKKQYFCSCWFSLVFLVGVYWFVCWYVSLCR